MTKADANTTKLYGGTAKHYANLQSDTRDPLARYFSSGLFPPQCAEKWS